MSAKIVAILGSYRKDGVIERTVEAVLEGARAAGAETRQFLLRDTPLEFCTNCRLCTQAGGELRGRCTQQDALHEILAAVDAADGLVLASPVNYYNATALFRRFLERLLGYTFWPWGQMSPRMRSKSRPRKAVLVASAGMPGFLIPLATGTARALRLAARMMGAKPIGNIWIGLTAGVPRPTLSARTRQKALRLGGEIALGN